MDPKNFYLKTFNLATNLTDQQLSELSAGFRQKEGRKGHIIQAGNREKNVYLLISGKVKVAESNRDGDETIKELVLPGDLFGDIMLNSEGQTNDFAEIVSDRATYYMISHDQLAAIMKCNYILTMNFMNKLCDKLKRLEDRYVNMLSKDVKSRLIYCFREWARMEGKKSGDKIIVKNSLTHNDLARLVSTSRQTVTVILNELRATGEITYNRSEISFSSLFLTS